MNYQCTKYAKEGDEKYEFATPNVEEEEDNNEGDEEVDDYNGYETDPYEFLPYPELDAEKTATGDCYVQEKVIIASDLVALYPSVTSSLAGECTFQAVLESEVTFHGVQYRELAKYVAMNCERVEVVRAGLAGVVPRRDKAKGPKPGVGGQHAQGPHCGRDDFRWRFPVADYNVISEADKRKLMAKGLEVAVRTMYDTHLFSWGGRVYHQLHGGPIGLRGSGSSCRITCNLMDRHVMKELEAIKNIPKVNYRFVDDTRALVRGVKDGWAWEDGKMVFSKEKEEEDKKSKDSLAQKTAKEFRKILDSFSPELKSTTETCDDFENGRCATLDFECWLEDDGKGGQKILYSYFEKLVSKKTAIMKKSALGENMKISSLTQEVIRRMKNTSLDVDMKERISIINKYHKRLQRSGYELQQIKKIISAGLLGWERIKKIAAESGGNINRSASETFIKRNTNRLLGKSTWYR